MVRHIVIWKLDDQYSEAEKARIKDELKVQLENLTKHISEIRSLSVNFNSELAVQTNFDIILDTSFSSFADLKSYQVHPKHLEVVKSVKSLKLERAGIDYEY